MIRLPLFAVTPRPWAAPDPDAFDALLLTSANAARLAGPDLARFAHLPVLAVGSATADAARASGLKPWLTGRHDASALLGQAAAAGLRRALHLSGRDGTALPPDVEAIVAERRIVYASDPLPVEAGRTAALSGSVALVHSARAAARLAALVDDAGVDRGAVWLAALGTPAAQAAGHGWAGITVAADPTDEALLRVAAALADAC